MAFFSLILSSILCLLFLLHALDLYRKRRLPPGPIGFPIIGNLLDIGPQPHESLAKLAKKHGPLMTLQLGRINIVVASTADAAREILQRNDEACSGRPVPDEITTLKHPELALLWIPTNETWQTIRKVVRMNLTNQSKLDTLVNLRESVVEEVVDFLRVTGHKNAGVDVGELAFAIALNQFWRKFFSKNVISTYEHDIIHALRKGVETAMAVMGKSNIADVFPILKPLDPQNLRWEAREAFAWLEDMIDGYVKERVKHRDSKLPRFGDVLDSMLDYCDDHNEDDFSVNHITALIVELLIAGTDTIACTTTWLMSELLLNPHMFSRVREEVSQIVEEDGKIEEAKTLNLPYLQAVIKETLRLHAGSPILAPHVTQTEVKIGSYVIPKNTQIIVNGWVMAQDSRYWENPTVFKPERFLGDKRDYKGQSLEFIPFGSGRRRCPGMPLAERMLSLIAAAFVYHFDWELPHATEEMDMRDTYGLQLQKVTPLLLLYP
ncbi:7-ethoxycoumarin O-deethylase-like [Bidens hawaiensis]|uniref:7-ethoxycoumarin O-deethylase-like n=1 Tax=Bidens hawaiensis TaxID=980011 RepID=UPI00404910B6